MYDVSVIIPNYNGEKFIKEAIDSVLNQARVNVEVIVVDDGSTDNSKDLLEAYGNRIKVFFQENKGAPAARNLGIKNASADFIKFLDSDDVLTKDTLKRELEISKKIGENKIAFGDILYIDKNSVVINSNPKLRVKRKEESELVHFLKNNPLTSSPLHRKAQLLSIDGFKNLPKGQEWDLHLRLFLKGYEFYYHKNFVYSFRIHEDEKRYSHLKISSVGSLSFLHIFNEQLKMIKDIYPNLSKEESMLLSHRYYSYGRAVLREGNEIEAIHYFKKAKELGGDKAVTGSMFYKFFVSVFSPVIAERIMSKVKGL